MTSNKASESCRPEPELLRLLARGEKEIKAGKGYDLDMVLAEADTLRKEMRRRGHLSPRACD